MIRMAYVSLLRTEGPMEFYKVLISPDDIQERVAELGREISADYAGKHPLIITLLKGGFIFLADLVRHITIPHEIDFVTLSSYRDGAKRDRKIQILDHLQTSIIDRHVLVVDEIIDTGHTIDELIRMLGPEQTRSMKICTLLDKPTAREVSVPAHYIGFTIPRVFVVGYGLDFMEHFRNLSCIAELKTAHRVADDGMEEYILERLGGGLHGSAAQPLRTAEQVARGIGTRDSLMEKPDS